MEPWEQEWYHTRALERAAAGRPCCRVCGDLMEEIDDLLYDGVCRFCSGEKDDDQETVYIL